MKVWVGYFWMHSAFLPEWVVKVVDGVIIVIDVVIDDVIVMVVMDVGVEISSLTLPAVLVRAHQVPRMVFPQALDRR